jgi:hypothetical protein
LAKFTRKPTQEVAKNREDQEEYYISSGSALFMTWLGVTLMIPGLALLFWPAERHIPWGIFFVVLGAYTAWTGLGSYRMIKRSQGKT